MTIYTGRGDEGSTSLIGGATVRKDDPRVEAYGTVDEADSAIGVARAVCEDEELRIVLRFTQQRLMNVASRVATPPGLRTGSTPGVSEDDVAFLERAIDLYVERAGGIDHFVLSGGSVLGASLQYARTVVRRAERRLASLPEADTDPASAKFLNRLSDLLFAVALFANVAASRVEIAWDPDAQAPAL
jgi:ATP:cob(I)alamin adenosyltransferase